MVKLRPPRNAARALDQPPGGGLRPQAAGKRAAGVSGAPAPDQIDSPLDRADPLAAAAGSSAQTTGTAGDPQPALKIAVVHGNLKFIAQAVLLGHYERDILASAERFLDNVFEGRLNERRHLDLYPGPLGTSTVVFHPRENGKPCAGLIVGLGPVGELTPGKLEEGVAQALVAYAVQDAERASSRVAGAAGGGGADSLQVASLLIGTGDRMLSTQDSVAAIVGGALRARAALAKGEASRRFRLRKLLFVELYLDRAVAAVRAVEALTRRTRFAREISVEPVLQEGEGGRRRVSYEEDPSWWSRLKIEGLGWREGVAGGAKYLKFTALTERARAEEIPLRVETTLVDQFVAAAVNSTGRDPAVSGTLFELLVPNAIKELAPQQRHQVLVLDEHSAAYPWELVHDRLRGEQQPFSVRAGLVRQLATSEYRQSPRPALGNHALVVGDPPSEFAPLPGAQQEARTVQALLHEKFKLTVTSRIALPALDVTQALFERQYRILHFAGHGVYRWDPLAKRQRLPGEEGADTVSGMVLGEGVFLTPGTIEQLRYVPEFVFLNCCYLGQIDADDLVPRGDRPRLAANLATQFIRMGAKAVIAAGWAVADDAAIAFAADFYTRLAAGEPFGYAVLGARQTVYQDHPGTNTWGAYQCYGDPGWVISGQRPDDGPPPRWVAFQEMVADLENWSEDARASSKEDRRWLTDRIGQAQQGIAPSWSGKAELLAAFGRAWGEVDQFDQAIARYEEALRSEPVTVSIRAAEQLANLRARAAIRKLGDPPVSATARRNALAQIDRSIHELDTLPTGDTGSGRSAERWSLLAGSYKRRSLVSSGAARLADLGRMADYYQGAQAAFARRHPGEFKPYPLLNARMAEVLRSHLGAGQLPDQLDAGIAATMAAATELSQRLPNFWTAAAISDALLLRHVAAGNLFDHVGEVMASYRDAGRLASAREARSILEHLHWVAEMLGTPTRSRRALPGHQRQRLRAAVDEIAAGLRDTSPPQPNSAGAAKTVAGANRKRSAGKSLPASARAAATKVRAARPRPASAAERPASPSRPRRKQPR